MTKKVTYSLQWVTGREPGQVRFGTTFVCLLFCALTVYEFAVTEHEVLKLILPSLGEIMHELTQFVFENNTETRDTRVFIQHERTPFGEHLALSLSRLGIGLAIGSVLGFGVSVAAMTSPLLRMLVDWVFRILNAVPWAIWVFVIPALLGFSYLAIVIAIAQTVLFKHITFVFYGLRKELYGSDATDLSRRLLIDRAVLSGINRWQLCRHLSIPLALPYLFSALRESSRTAANVIIILEVTLATGIGAQFHQEINNGDMAGAFAVAAIISAIIFIVWQIIQIVEYRVLRWSR